MSVDDSASETVSSAGSSDEEEEEDTGDLDASELTKASNLLKQHNSTDESVNFQELFKEHPLPALQIEGATEEDIDNFGEGFHNIDFSSQGATQECQVSPSSASQSGSKCSKGKAPSKGNRQDHGGGIKKNKKTRKKKKKEEVDDSRPSTDQAAFAKLQHAKQQHRREQQKSARTPNSSRNQQNMSDTPDSSLPGSPVEAENGQDSSQGEQQQQGESQESSPNAQASKESSASQPETAAVPRKKGQSKRGTKRKEPPIDPTLTKEEEEAKMKSILQKQHLLDKKMNKDKRLQLIAQLRQQIYICRHNNNTLTKYKKKYVEVEKELGDLKTAHNAILAEKEEMKSKAKAQLLRVNREIKKQAEDKAKDELWSKRKFISCPEEEIKAAEFVLNLLDLPNHTQNQDARDSWVETYKSLIKKAHFGRRNYITSEVKKIAWACFTENTPLPTLESLMKCATRSIETEEDMVLFKWYWETVIPKMVGASRWGNRQCYYATLSTATVEGNRRRKLVTISDEAMLLVIWDNSWQRWKDLYEWTLKPENQPKPDDKTKKKQPNLNGKYTVCDGGQSDYGTWTPEGLEAYNKYFKMVKAGRKKESTPNLEKKCLQQLRDMYNITCHDADAQNKLNRKNSRLEKKGITEQPPAIPAKMHKVVRTIADSDSDTDDETE